MCFARLPNLAIFSGFPLRYRLDLAIQASNLGGFFSLRQAASSEATSSTKQETCHKMGILSPISAPFYNLPVYG